MTGAGDLLALVERLGAATGADRELDGKLWEATSGAVTWMPLSGPQMGCAPYADVPPLTASLDAAVALVERVLPGASWTINSFDVQRKPHRVRVVRTHISSYAHPDILHSGASGEGPTEPIALCLALVRALLAQRGRSPTPPAQPRTEGE